MSLRAFMVLFSTLCCSAASQGQEGLGGSFQYNSGSGFAGSSNFTLSYFEGVAQADGGLGASYCSSANLNTPWSGLSTYGFLSVAPYCVGGNSAVSFPVNNPDNGVPGIPFTLNTPSTTQMTDFRGGAAAFYSHDWMTSPLLGKPFGFSSTAYRTYLPGVSNSTGSVIDIDNGQLFYSIFNIPGLNFGSPASGISSAALTGWYSYTGLNIAFTGASQGIKSPLNIQGSMTGAGDDLLANQLIEVSPNYEAGSDEGVEYRIDANEAATPTGTVVSGSSGNTAGSASITTTCASNLNCTYVGVGRPLLDEGTTFPLGSAANAISGKTTYTGSFTGGASNAYAGRPITISGFTNAVNNGVFTITASAASSITVNNTSGVAETTSASGLMGVVQTTATIAAPLSGQPQLYVYTTSNVTWSASQCGTLMSEVDPSANANGVNPPISYQVTLTGLSSALTAGTLVGLFGASIPTTANTSTYVQTYETAAVTAPGTYSGGSQTVYLYLHDTHAAGSWFCAGGPVGDYLEQTDYTFSGNRYVQYIYGTVAGMPNELYVGALKQGSVVAYPESFGLSSSIPVNIYQGADVADVRDPSALNNADGKYYGLQDNVTTWQAGDNIEEVNAISQTWHVGMGSANINNPYASVDGYGRITGYGGGMSGIFSQFNGPGVPASQYTYDCPPTQNCRSSFHLPPTVAAYTGPIGTVFAFASAPVGGNTNGVAPESPDIIEVDKFAPCVAYVNNGFTPNCSSQDHLSVTSAANASGGSTVYTGTFPNCGSNACTGNVYWFSGFVINPGDNGEYTCTASTTVTLTCNNSGGIYEAPAAAFATGQGTINCFNYTETQVEGGAHSIIDEDCGTGPYALQKVFSAPNGIRVASSFFANGLATLTAGLTATGTTAINSTGSAPTTIGNASSPTTIGGNVASYDGIKTQGLGVPVMVASVAGHATGSATGYIGCSGTISCPAGLYRITGYAATSTIGTGTESATFSFNYYDGTTSALQTINVPGSLNLTALGAKIVLDGIVFYTLGGTNSIGFTVTTTGGSGGVWLEDFIVERLQ